MSNEHPELSGYEPTGHERPLRSKHLTRAMRVIVVLGLVALVVPGVLTTVQVATTTATNACLAAVAQYYPLSVDYDARFEMAGAGGFGWQPERRRSRATGSRCDPQQLPEDRDEKRPPDRHFRH